MVGVIRKVFFSIMEMKFLYKLNTLIFVSILIGSLLISGCDNDGDPRVVPLVTTENKLENQLPYSVTCFGKLTNKKGGEVTSCGFCWSTQGTPSIKNDKVESVMDSSGNFTATIEGLTSKVAYIIKAYVITNKGVGYGKPLAYKAPPLATIFTKAVTDITPTTAMCGGIIVYDYGLFIFENGLCWRKNSVPTVDDYHQAYGSATGDYTVQMTNLEPSTTYLVRAYSKCKLGVEYGDLVSFTTPNR
jgi:hypothetical protein